MANPSAPPVCFDVVRVLAGDADFDGIVSISDALFVYYYIFRGGPAPQPLRSGDFDCNGQMTISDVVYMLNYIFAGGAAPC
ncbi:MAG: dockerin type I domain-containing protein [Candidatus Zixiibacteriota bacterium]